MKKIIYLSALFGIVLILLTFQNSFSQVTQEWVARYNGPGNLLDEASSIAVDGTGNVYVTGYSTGSGTGKDYVTIKYNSSGDSVWARRYNGPGNWDDDASSIAVDGTGNVYVTGYSTGSGTDVDYATIKYNSSGVQQWVKRYSGPGNGGDEAYSISVDSSGNVYVTGHSAVSGTGIDYATIKYNSSGDSVWVRRYNGPGNSYDFANSLAVDGSGNVYVTGFSIVSGGVDHYATVKYNSSGDSVWVNRYAGPGNSSDRASSIAVDGTGNVYVTGYSTGSGTGWDYATIKYNPSGDSVWVRRYNGPGNSWDEASSIAVDGTGNVYVTGYSAGDYATIKYNSSGDSVWVRKYYGSGNTYFAASLAVDGSGNVYVTGSSRGSGGVIDDYTTIKYNSSGLEQWVARYYGPEIYGGGASSIAVDGSGYVYVTGTNYGSETSGDYATIKYSQSTGISQLSTEIPEQLSLTQNYPNPFNPVTNFEFGISDLGFVSLKVYTTLGKEVSTLVNEKLGAGKYKVEFDGSGLPSGVYFYRLVTEGFEQTKRMILLK